MVQLLAGSYLSELQLCASLAVPCTSTVRSTALWHDVESVTACFRSILVCHRLITFLPTSSHWFFFFFTFYFILFYASVFYLIISLVCKVYIALLSGRKDQKYLDKLLCCTDDSEACTSSPLGKSQLPGLAPSSLHPHCYQVHLCFSLWKGAGHSEIRNAFVSFWPQPVQLLSPWTICCHVLI